jgi:hypothetical protein
MVINIMVMDMVPFYHISAEEYGRGGVYDCMS